MNHMQPSRSRHPEQVEPTLRLMRLPAVLQVTGPARSTVYRMVAVHTFPAPVKLAARAVGWRHDDRAGVVRRTSECDPPARAAGFWFCSGATGRP